MNETHIRHTITLNDKAFLRLKQVEFSIQFILGFNFNEFGAGVAQRKSGCSNIAWFTLLGLLDETAFPVYTKSKVTLIEKS
jgi:hypothetical protein